MQLLDFPTGELCMQENPEKLFDYSIYNVYFILFYYFGPCPAVLRIYSLLYVLRIISGNVMLGIKSQSAVV